MKAHRTLPSRKRITGLIVLAVFLGGLAHGWLHAASGVDDVGHFTDADVCFLGAPLATAPCAAEFAGPVSQHARDSVQPTQALRQSRFSNLPPARAPPLV